MVVWTPGVSTVWNSRLPSALNFSYSPTAATSHYNLQRQRFVQPLQPTVWNSLGVHTRSADTFFWHLRTGLKLNCLNLATRNCFGATVALQIRLRIEVCGPLQIYLYCTVLYCHSDVLFYIHSKITCTIYMSVYEFTLQLRRTTQGTDFYV